MKVINLYALFILFLYPLFTIFSFSQAEAEETFELVVEKHVLLPGEHLVNVLRNTYKIPDRLIFNEYLNLIKEINPDVKDLNTMVDYQTLLIPLTLVPKNKDYRIVFKETERTSRIIPTIKEEKKPPASPVKPRREVALERINFETFLQSEFTSLLDESGSTIQQEGIHEFPDFEGSQLSLDTATYPIIQCEKNNTFLIMDYYNRLPDEIKEVIQSNWNNYKIVPSGKDQGLESTIDQILKEMSFFKVIEQGEPLVRGEDVLIKIVGDWIVYPDSALQKAFVVNLINSPEHITATSIKRYLEEHGIKLIDLDLFEQSEDESSFVMEDKGEDAGSSEISQLDFTDKVTFVETLLELAEQDYSQNVPISVYSRDNTGLALNVTIDITFVKNGKKHLIYLQKKSPKLLSLLTKQGFPLLKLTSEEDAVTTVKKVLDFLKVDYKSPIITFAASKTNQDNKIWVNIPGILFETERKKVLLTHLSLPPTLISFLEEKGVQTTIYQ